MTRQLASEVIGTALLLMAAVGSGAMGTALAGGNAGLALLASALVTGGTLYVIITTLGPVSGAHFNPAVTLYFLLRGEFAAGLALAYVAAQCLGGFIGVWTVHLMFAEPVIQVSQTMHRTGGAQWFSELVATLGLLFTIAAGTGSGTGGHLHRRRLLVHLVHQPRQPGGHAGARVHRHGCGHLSGACADVRPVAAGGRPGRRLGLAAPVPLGGPQASEVTHRIVASSSLTDTTLCPIDAS
jgi:hypothetical protein